MAAGQPVVARIPPGGGTASGLIDGAGYLGGVLAGDTMARISVTYGWSKAFLTLAVIAFLSSITATWFLMKEKKAGRLEDAPA